MLQKSTAFFSNTIKSKITNILEKTGYSLVVVSFKRLLNETVKGETHIMEMKIWLKNTVDEIPESHLNDIKTHFQANLNENSTMVLHLLNLQLVLQLLNLQLVLQLLNVMKNGSLHF